MASRLLVTARVVVGASASMYGCADAESVTELCAHVDGTSSFGPGPILPPDEPDTADETDGGATELGTSPTLEPRMGSMGDDRVPVTDVSALESFPLRSVGRIRAEQPAGPLPVALVATGVMIGPRHVLTAAHTVYVDLEDYGGPPGFTNLVTDTASCGGGAGDVPCFEVTFSPGELGGGTPINGPPRTVVDAFIDPTYLELPNFNYDYAVLVLADAVETAALGWWQLCTPSSVFFANGAFQLVGYPANSNQCELSPHPEGLCAGFMYQHPRCTVEHAYQNIVFHSCDSQAGESGGPLFLGCPGGTPCVAGVHASGGSSNTATRVTPERVQTITEQALCAHPSIHALDSRCD